MPLSRQRVEELAKFHFSQGHDFFSVLLEAAVPAASALTEFPTGVRLISPEEQAHCVIVAAAKSLPEVTNAEREQWKRTLPFG